MEKHDVKLATAKALLQKCLPYIKQHFDRSVFGDGAKRLIREIEEFIASVF